ncbi:phage portal protein [Paenibacillus melissococcoides]|uniref:phage portal protein n=1 Tax=Paenibacillus melissococcoides TaxID=2912268 RepID=UPI0036F2B162
MPSGQSSNTAQHVTTMLRLIGASVGLSYEAVSRDLGNVTYSSARQGVVEDRKTYKRYIRSLVNRVLTPIFTNLLRRRSLSVHCRHRRKRILSRSPSMYGFRRAPHG